MALVRSDPIRDVDRLFQQLWGGAPPGGGSRSLAMPMDAYRKDDAFLIRLDLPGVPADAVELTVEDDVLTIRAERAAPPSSDEVEPVIAERPHGTYVRQVFLGRNLDTSGIRAECESGVLTVVIPVAEQAKARRIEVTERGDKQELAA